MSALWCVHILGPDTMIAQPDRETAERRAAEWNRMFAELGAKNSSPHDPKLEARVVAWPYTAASHAADVLMHGGSPKDIC